MPETKGNYQEPDSAIEAAFPYALADNDRNRMVFSSGYRAGRDAARKALELANAKAGAWRRKAESPDGFVSEADARLLALGPWATYDDIHPVPEGEPNA